MPPWLLLWGLGKPYACPRCNAKQLVPRGSGFGIALAAFVVHWRFKDDFSGLQSVGFVLGLLVLVALLSWLTMRPRLVESVES